MSAGRMSWLEPQQGIQCIPNCGMIVSNLTLRLLALGLSGVWAWVAQVLEAVVSREGQQGTGDGMEHPHLAEHHQQAGHHRLALGQGCSASAPPALQWEMQTVV